MGARHKVIFVSKFFAQNGVLAPNSPFLETIRTVFR